MMTTYPELADALQRRTLALFLGADLPREVAGVPSRAELARDLARRHGLDESLPLAEVAQRVSPGGNRWAFTAFIRDALDAAGATPRPFQQRLAAFAQRHEIGTVVTTAYDNLLELAFRQAGVSPNVVTRGGDAHFIRPDRPTILKLYGDAQQPDTLVVTDQDHMRLLRDRDREPLIDEVRQVFRRNTILFLGYNLADPDFRFVFDQVAESRFARAAYAVWPDLSPVDVRMWHDRGITILDSDPFDLIENVASPAASQPVKPADAPQLDYGRGLAALKALAAGAGWEQDFLVFEASLRENLDGERRYGPSEQLRHDRRRIVDQLNALALAHAGMSFNDLCLSKAPARRDEHDPHP